MKKNITAILAGLIIVSFALGGCAKAGIPSDQQMTVSNESTSGESVEEITGETTEETTENASADSETETKETSQSETEEEELTETAEAAAMSVDSDSPVNYDYTEVTDDYFDDAVFIGDSISYGLNLYVTGRRAEGENLLGKGVFLTSGSLSYANSLWDVSDESVHPTYNGEKMKLESAIEMIQPKKVYILLGTNDVALYGVEQTIVNADTEISRILEADPQAEIFIMSTTPKYSPAEVEVDGELNNSSIDQLNVAMREFADEKGYNFLNIAPMFKDETGGLAADYCSDKESMGIHFTYSAYDMWLDFLYTYGKKQ